MSTSLNPGPINYDGVIFLIIPKQRLPFVNATHDCIAKGALKMMVGITITGGLVQSIEF